MCGIAYAHDFTGQPVNNLILDVFDNQRRRGTQGFGLFDGREKHLVRATTEDQILKWLCKYNSNLILFHHRYPTSTDNTKNTAHPFATKDFFGNHQYILVHNGHITNSKELQRDHAAMGISYRSIEPDGRFNDSESLLWDFALYMEGRQDKLKAYGGIAFICLRLKDGKLDKLYFGRNTNPLNMLREEDGILLSSEGEGEAITVDTLYTWHYTSKRLTNKQLTIPQYYYQAHPWPTGGQDQPETFTDDQDFTYVGEKTHYVGENPILDDDFWETFDWAQVKEPTILAVKLCAALSIRQAKGYFYEAYMNLEDEYCQIVEDAQTMEDFERIKLLRQAMEWIDSDPEYLNDDSVSSHYQQQQLMLGGA